MKYNKAMFVDTLVTLCKYRNIDVECKGNSLTLIYRKIKLSILLVDYNNNRVKEIKVFKERNIEEEYTLDYLFDYLEKELKKERLLRRLKSSGKPIKKYRVVRRKLDEMGRDRIREYVNRQNRHFGLRSNLG